MNRETEERVIFSEDSLFSFLNQVAQEEGFAVNEERRAEFIHFYHDADETQGDRCVDDRTPKLEFTAGQYPYASGEYTGIQLPGGTFGIIDSLRYVVRSLSDEQARVLIYAVYQSNHWRFGDHIDDDHGQITDALSLQSRNLGCGDQDKKREGMIPMFQGLVQPEDVDGRFAYIREIGGYLPVLTGGHHPQAALVNLQREKTYNNQEASVKDKMAFNLDLWALEKRARAIYQALTEAKFLNSTEVLLKQFTEDFIKAVLRNYLQTLSALGQRKEIVLIKPVPEPVQ